MEEHNLPSSQEQNPPNGAIIEEVILALRDGTPVPELTDTKVDSQEVIPIIARQLNLPPGTELVFHNGNQRSFSCDVNHIGLLVEVAERVKGSCVDRMTGLQTQEVFKAMMASEIQQEFDKVFLITGQEIPLDQAILGTTGVVTDEYRDNIVESIKEIAAEAKRQEISQSEAQERVRHVLRKNYLLSYMSTISVAFTDVKGLAAANTWNEKHPRPDMDSQESTGETGLKPSGRSKQALSILSGSSEYVRSLRSCDGTTVKVWNDPDITVDVNSETYLQRAKSLCGEEDLGRMQDRNLEIIPFRLRPDAGDEGLVLIKRRNDAHGRHQALTEEDIALSERLVYKASYVVVAEYSEDETNTKLDLYSNAFGKNSRLEQFRGSRLPLILVDRIGSARMDQIYLGVDLSDKNLTSIPIEELVIKPIEIAMNLAWRQTDINKLSEDKNSLRSALNGDLLAQISLIALDKRFPVNPEMLQQILASERYNNNTEFTEEDVEFIIEKARLRKDDVKPSNQ